MVCAYHSILGDHGLHTSSLHPLPRDASLPPFASIHHSRGRKEPAPPLQRTKPDPPPPSPSHVSQHALAATLARHSSAKTASAPRGVDREALVDMGQIKYSEKYFNDTYEYSPPARGRQAPPQEPPPIRERVARDRSAAEPRVGALRDPPPGDAHHAVPPPDQLPAAVGGGFRADAGQENRLKQVQEMQSNCDKGLKHMSCEAPLLGPMAELWKLKNPDISESEWAVQAAAASIYSTCNMAMRTENVSCF
uniref:Uncharacterized protein n=1 Tax=Zea mays TaxID=4577 RepID=A0A804U7Q3_MAIZE